MLLSDEELNTGLKHQLFEIHKSLLAQHVLPFQPLTPTSAVSQKAGTSQQCTEWHFVLIHVLIHRSFESWLLLSQNSFSQLDLLGC